MLMDGYIFHAAIKAESEGDPGEHFKVLVRLQGIASQGHYQKTENQSQSYKIQIYITNGACALSHQLSLDALDQYCRERSLTSPNDPSGQPLYWLEAALASESCKLVYKGDSLGIADQAAIESKVQVPGLPRSVPIRLPTEVDEFLQICPPELSCQENLNAMLQLCAEAAAGAAAKREVGALKEEIAALHDKLQQREQDEREYKRQRQEDSRASSGQNKANLRKPARPAAGSGGTASGALQRPCPSLASQLPAHQPASTTLLPSSQPVLVPFSQYAASQQLDPLLNLHGNAVGQEAEPLKICNTAVIHLDPCLPSMAASQLDTVSEVDQGSQLPPSSPCTQLPTAPQLTTQSPASAASQPVQPPIASQTTTGSQLPTEATTLSPNVREGQSPIQQPPRGRGRGRYIPPIRGKGPRKPLFGPQSG